MSPTRARQFPVLTGGADGTDGVGTVGAGAVGAGAAGVGADGVGCAGAGGVGVVGKVITSPGKIKCGFSSPLYSAISCHV